MGNNQESCELLHYVNDSIPGITRIKKKNHFIYINPDKSEVNDPKTIERIKSLAIPPAYSEVWVCPHPDGHIQATARDSRNRKQYRYHPKWCAQRELNKFTSMRDFGKALPIIRSHLKRILNKPLKMEKDQIICGIIYLLDNHFIRIGNAIYEKQNQSYGLTTLRKKHLTIKQKKAQLTFKGKNSKTWDIVLEDKKIIKLLKKCEALPGYKLFKYLDNDGHTHEITSVDINNYLRKLTKKSFTAKDFRTWGACRETFYHLCQLPSASQASAKKHLSSVVARVASLLGHSTAICQKSYIYPEIINQWKSGKITLWIKKNFNKRLTKDNLFLKWLESLNVVPQLKSRGK